MNDSMPTSTVLTMSEKIQRLKDNIHQVFIGQPQIVDQILIALLAKGHVLIEGVPGLGKTLLVKTLSLSINAQYKRVQFTPDLMPADIIGHSMFEMKSEQFRIRKGPAFTNFLLADEINRAPAKTQAALLEVMQEHKITIDGQSIPTPVPFMVMATQNPIEHEGTYPLPEAQLDRFLMKLLISYPETADEIRLTQLATSHSSDDFAVEPVMHIDELLQLQAYCVTLTVDERLIDYAVRLCQATRTSPSLVYGAGPRASIALIRCAKVYAVLQGRDFVLPDDIKAVAKPVLRHRIKLSADVEINGVTADFLLAQLLQSIDAPHL